VTGRTRRVHGVDLRGSRVFITGGAGLVGSTFADHLVTFEPAELVVLHNLTRGGKENLAWFLGRGPVTIVDGDIRDATLVAEVVKGIDVLFHQAAIRLPHCARGPASRTGGLGRRHVQRRRGCRACRVRKMVAASFGPVYGMAERFRTLEDHHPYGNRTLYGAAKPFVEGLLRSFHELHDLDHVALRYFNVYGPRMDVQSAHVEVLVEWVAHRTWASADDSWRRKPNPVDFVFVDDVARANILVAMSSVSDGLCNVGSGAEASLEELARTLIAAMGTDVSPAHAPRASLNPVPWRVIDTSAAYRFLGWRPEVDLPTGIEHLVDWWRDSGGVDLVGFP
jgi:nucleoside-diphosphate-sugar epimerase